MQFSLTPRACHTPSCPVTARCPPLPRGVRPCGREDHLHAWRPVAGDHEHGPGARRCRPLLPFAGVRVDPATRQRRQRRAKRFSLAGRPVSRAANAGGGACAGCQDKKLLCEVFRRGLPGTPPRPANGRAGHRPHLRPAVGGPRQGAPSCDCPGLLPPAGLSGGTARNAPSPLPSLNAAAEGGFSGRSC